MNFSRLSVKRAVLVSMVYLGVVGFGLFSYFRLPRDLFPDLTFPVVVVVTQYSGAGPEDVEQLVSRPIEAAVASVEGVKEVSSTSKYGISVVNIEFSWGTDMTKAETDIRKNIDLFAKSFLPDEVEDPITFAFDPSLQPVVFLMVSGPDGPAAVRKTAEDMVEPRLERIPGVASADSAGGRKREIHVEIIPERLRSFRVAPAQVVNAIRTANLQLPGGAIRQGGQLLTIETKGRFTQIDQIKDVIVMKRPQREIRVKDVARVKDWFEERTRYITVGGRSAVMTMIRKQSDANTVIVVDRVMAQIESIKKVLPEGYKVQVMFDQATIIKRSLGNVVNTGLQAFLLAGVVLLIFLFSIKAGVIVASAIPISLLVTFAVMDTAGVTLNMISMSGLALAIGMLVDNAIVVLENIFRHYQMGKEPKEAATVGASEVSTAITAATLTTLSVFIPILFVPGIAGALFKDMVITICFSLAASLAVAVTLIPMLASRLLARQEKKGKKGWWAKRLEGTVEKVSRVVDGLWGFCACVRSFPEDHGAHWCFDLCRLGVFAHAGRQGLLSKNRPGAAQPGGHHRLVEQCGRHPEAGEPGLADGGQRSSRADPLLSRCRHRRGHWRHLQRGRVFRQPSSEAAAFGPAKAPPTRDREGSPREAQRHPRRGGQAATV